MTDLRVGCSSWTSPAWTGRFYPSGIADGDRLEFYARYFDTVEVDATYYAPPNPFVVRGWARKVPESFVFALKMPRDLIDPKKPSSSEDIGRFVGTVRLLGPKLGPVLLQFPPWFRPARSVDAGHSAFLFRLLDSLPSGPRYAVELRDAGWYSGEHRKELVRALAARGMASCWSALNYLEVPPLVTADWAYLRFIGDHTSIPDQVHGEIRADRSAVTKKWVDELTSHAAELRSAWSYFNNHFAGYAPISAERFQRELGLRPVVLPVDAQKRLD